jgi:hypothetical protein
MKPYRLNLTKLVVLTVLFLSACGGGGEKKEESASSEFDAAKKQLAEDVEKVLVDLPPPSEVPYLIMATGAEFDESLSNPIDRVSAYQNDKTKAALNLGVYAADIAYLSSYDKSEDALQYMNDSKALASVIGVDDAIDLGMIARFESNMTNKDSLAAITNDIMKTSGQRLSELDEMESAALLLVGSWIEGLYLSTSIVNNYPEDLPEEARTLVLEPIIKIIIDQKKSLEDLLLVIGDVPQTDGVTALKGELLTVQAIYDGPFAEVEKEITENTGSLVITPETINPLHKEISRIRNSIVQ